MRSRWLPLLGVALACGGGRPAEDASRSALRLPVAPAADPTLRPARLVPLGGEEGAQKTYGTEPGGGTRLLVSGVRIVRLAGGGVQSAESALPSEPTAIAPVPERLGGGFLFAIGMAIFRAGGWLEPLTILYEAPQNPTRLLVGLDRAYVRLPNGAWLAFDAKTGAPMDLGPWPGGPEVSRFVAADGWRAVAIADLRGAVATFDAGGKWQPLDLPIQPRELHLVGDAIVLSGLDAHGAVSTTEFAVEPNGQIAHVEQEPERAHKPKDSGEASVDQRIAHNPLASAVLDGWPLEGGTALVARDGSLQRVRMSDGAVLDTAPDAFPLKPARCHPLSLSPPNAPAVFGFVCGVPRGATEIYRYDPAGGRLVTLRHFDLPRAVFSPGNGTLVIEGPCQPDAPFTDVKKTEQLYCIMRKTGAFEDFIVNGDVGTERVIPLSDGRTAILSPPAGDLATARLTIFDGNRAKTFPLAFAQAASSTVRGAGDDDDSSEPDADAIVTAVLRSGTWLRGVQERKPGVLSAWVEHSGRYVGVEVTLDGLAKHGPYVADLGMAVVSGRYGLGWTPSRQGYETTDGGMTWAPLVLPEPLESAGPAAGSTVHGCGPLGCVLAGWIRVGWTSPEDVQSTSYSAAMAQRTFDVRSPHGLSLRCELSGRIASPTQDTGSSSSNYYYYRRYYYRQQYVTRDWQPFYTLAAPTLGTDDYGYSMRSDEVFDHGADKTNNANHLGLGSALARFYAWGPKGLEWDSHGRYVVRFTSPFESSSVLHATQTTGIPRYIADSTAATAVSGTAHPIQSYALVAGDDGTHALLVLHRWTGYGYGYGYGYGGYGSSGPSADDVLVELEAERPPLELHHPDGSALGELESAVRMAGKWYVAVSDGTVATVVYEVETGVAREIARIPRTAEGSTRPPAVHLARRADGRMLAALVDGAPLGTGATRPSRWVAETWALPIDVETGVVHEPERLGASDGGNKDIRVCGVQDAGWVVDGRWPGGALTLTAASGLSLAHTGNTFARYHVTAESVCLEKLSTSSYGEIAGVGSLGKAEGPSVQMGLYADQARQAFRCIADR